MHNIARCKSKTSMRIDLEHNGVADYYKCNKENMMGDINYIIYKGNVYKWYRDKADWKSLADERFDRFGFVKCDDCKLLCDSSLSKIKKEYHKLFLNKMMPYEKKYYKEHAIIS